MSPDFSFDHNADEPDDRLKKISSLYIKSWLDRPDKIKAKVKALILDQLKAIEVSGRNLVVADVIVKYVIKTLQRDLELLEQAGKDSFDIHGREITLYGEFHGQRFKGIIDRLDSFAEGQLRVVDYKTGKVLPDDEDIHDGNAEDVADSIFEQDIEDRPKIALQFYIYDMLLRQNGADEGLSICNSVYSTAHLFKDPPKTVPLNDIFYDSVTRHLEALLDQMCNVDVTFRRTEDEKACAYCDFKTICGR